MGSLWIAFVLDIFIGDPYWFYHPVRIMGKYIVVFEQTTRKFVTSKEGLKIAGIFLTISTILLTYIISIFIVRGSAAINFYFYIFINIVLLWTAIAPKSLMMESMKVYYALKDKNINQARLYLSYIVGRDTTQLTEEEIAKGAIETVAENLSDGVIAPILYAFIGGAPLALTYKGINTLDSMVGYNNDKYKFFGWASAKTDDIANYLPARLTGVLIFLASILLKRDAKNSWRIMVRDNSSHLSPNAGFPEAAAAGALGIKLGGPCYYGNNLVKKPSMGDSLKSIEVYDIKRMNVLMYTSTFLMLIILTTITFLF
ncbi:adenosylcobinamide-phosphate synthase CbiB [Proteinivorax tanatarense]|uniref:Cobalamin biosynthesis protein CobD n=1 Tax=Proteinivorax tanatarense TaxID=1260629 RepID=A0AAU7VJ37_9FIRM